MPAPTAVVLVFRRDRVLALLRGSSAPWYPDTWNLPGGACEPGETPEEGAIRECREETGIRLQHTTLFRVVSMGADGDLYVFTARDESSYVGICWESADYQWVGLHDLGGMSFVPYVEDLFREVLSDESRLTLRTT